MQGIALEVARTFQRERARAEMLYGKPADALARGEKWPTRDGKGQGGIVAAKFAQKHPVCNIEYIKKVKGGGLDDAGGR